MTTKNTTTNTPFTKDEIAKAIAGVNRTMQKMAPLIPGIIADAIAKNTTTTTTNAKRQRALDLAKKRIGDCRNITPEMLVDADKATKTIASVTKHPLVLDISDERDRGDGIWVYLHDGWISDILGTSTIHEDTWAECISLLKEVYFDRSTMHDQDDDAPKQATSEPEAIVPVVTTTKAIRLSSTIVLMIQRIIHQISVRSAVSSMSSRLDIDATIESLVEATGAIMQDERQRAIDLLRSASETIALVVEDVENDGRVLPSVRYNLRDGRNAIDGLIINYFS